MLLATVLLVAGCSGGGSTPETVTVTQMPSTDAMAMDEVPEPTIESASIFDSQFDPCEVFTDEELAPVGLHRLGEKPSDIGNGVFGCGLGIDESVGLSGTFFMATDQINRSDISDQNLDPADWSESIADGIYTHKMPGNMRECVSAVDFSWGRLAVDYLDSGEGSISDQLCMESVRILEFLIVELRSISGTQD